LEQCQSAAEFLLEPWILVQLPFQPILFHQWSVALLAEALKFEKELFELYYVPKKLRSPVVKLLEMCNLMYEAAFKFFEHFGQFIFRGEQSMCDNVVSEYLKHMPDVLPVIKFVLSDECRSIVKVLTKMAFQAPQNSLHPRDQTILKSNATDFCYHFIYWKKKSIVHSIAVPKNSGEGINWKDLNVKSYESEITATEMEGLKNLIREKFILTGRIRGETEDFIFGLLQGGILTKLISFYREYVKILGWYTDFL